MIDIDRAERFSPFRVWARGGQAPLRAQAILPAVPAARTGHGLRLAGISAQVGRPAERIAPRHGNQAAITLGAPTFAGHPVREPIHDSLPQSADSTKERCRRQLSCPSACEGVVQRKRVSTFIR